MDVLKKYDEESEHWERKVLIVDDEKISCDVLRCILEKKYEILTAENGREALEILQCYGTKISLILLDLLVLVLEMRVPEVVILVAIVLVALLVVILVLIQMVQGI